MKNHNNNTQSNDYRICLKLLPIFTIIFIISLFSIMNPNLTNVPELSYENNNNQTLKLLVPPRNCKYCEKTLFFTSNLRKNKGDINNHYDIIEYKNKKNYFVTYYMGDEEYEQYEDLLEQHGVIKSVNAFADNNFYFSKRSLSLIKKYKDIMNLNNYKKFYRFFGFQILMKDTLYMSYLEMKKEFNEDYNYMSETYYYPDDKKIIKEKFGNYSLNINNLWLIKPAHLWGGFGVRIFQSLKDIKLKSFLLNKYMICYKFGFDS